VQTKVVELQKSPYAGGTQSKAKLDGMRYNSKVNLTKRNSKRTNSSPSQPVCFEAIVVFIRGITKNNSE